MGYQIESKKEKSIKHGFTIRTTSTWNSCNEVQHNLEEFTEENTKHKIYRWITSMCLQKVGRDDICSIVEMSSNDATEVDIDKTDNRQKEQYDLNNKLTRAERE